MQAKECLSLKEFILDNVIVCAQPTTNDNEIIKRKCLDLEMYFRVIVSSSDDGLTTSFKVPTGIGIGFNELFEAASKNTERALDVMSIADAIGLADDGGVNLYVVGLEGRMYGAGVIFLNRVFRKICAALGANRLIVIPCSIHEILVMPYDGALDLSSVDKCVSNVNDFCVKECDLLSDHAYYYDDEVGCVAWGS